ncbi:outer membrane protein assembly factor BamD [candidate division WOR-3 bacterium]|nr:outer membrane protein assembly factor BamD [candidate division WOR-3 bacterium]
MSHLGRLVLPVLLLAVAGCPKRAEVQPVPQDAGQALDQAIASLDARHFRRAEDQLTFIIFNFPGSRQASDAQYYLAETYFRSKDYLQAQSEFDFYLKSFPNGRFQEEATYKLAVSYLRSAPSHVRDQARALKAQETINRFLEDYPDSPLRPDAEKLLGEIAERLALREFDAARLYYTSGEYKSALVYYDYVDQTYPAGRWPDMERYRFAVSLLETADTAKAREVLSALVTGPCEPEVKKLARAALGRTSH